MRDHDHHHHDRHHGPRDRRDGPRDHGPDRGPDWHRDDRCRCGCGCDSDCDCGCQQGSPCHCDGPDQSFAFERKFFSRAEMIEALEAYLEELENEAQGVREALAELHAATLAPQEVPAAPEPETKPMPRKRGRPRTR